MKRGLVIRRGDLCIALGVVLLAGLLLLAPRFVRREGAVAYITVDGAHYDTLPLDTPATLRVQTQSGYNLIRVAQGYVFVEQADCRNQVCVHHAPVSQAGESIVCLPHALVVEIGER